MLCLLFNALWKDLKFNEISWGALASKLCVYAKYNLYSHFIFKLLAFVTYSTVAADTRFAAHEEHAEQAGRVHGLLLPRLHLRPLALAAQQPARRTRGHQAATADAVAVQQRFQPSLHAGESNLQVDTLAKK